jgi:hypothetical protein
MKKIVTTVAGALLSGSLALPALADQCQLVGKSQALAALNYLSIGQTIYSFCEPCGDKTPKPIRINKIAVSSGDDGKLWRVLVNNQNIDLAYTYIRYEPKYQVSLAVITKCPTQGVTPVINIKTK